MRWKAFSTKALAASMIVAALLSAIPLSILEASGNPAPASRCAARKCYPSSRSKDVWGAGFPEALTPTGSTLGSIAGVWTMSRIPCESANPIYNHAVKVILDIEVPCPVSGLKLNGKICDFHKVPLIRLDNGSIMAYCPNHRSRTFIADRTTCFMISKDANVVERIPQPLKKEPKHGAT